MNTAQCVPVTQAGVSGWHPRQGGLGHAVFPWPPQHRAFQDGYVGDQEADALLPHRVGLLLLSP